MKKVIYQVLRSVVEVEDQSYDTYGIRCIKENKVLKTVEDVSPEQGRVESLVAALNKEQLDPIQLDDVIEDIL